METTSHAQSCETSGLVIPECDAEKRGIGRDSDSRSLPHDRQLECKFHQCHGLAMHIRRDRDRSNRTAHLYVKVRRPRESLPPTRWPPGIAVYSRTLCRTFNPSSSSVA